MYKLIMSLVIAIVVMMSNTARANTQAKQTETVNYQFALSMREINRNLRLDITQFEILSQTSHSLSRRIERLATVSPERRYELLTLFVADNLSTVRNYLSNDQFQLYRTMLDDELQQQGLTSILNSRDAASIEEEAK